jgi:hypothetical protein
LEAFFGDNIRFIDNDKVYLFSKIHIFKPEFFDIYRHPSIIRECIQFSRVLYPDEEKYMGKNVFLVKTNNHTNVVTKNTCFNANKLLMILSNNPQWIVIQPERMNIFEIIAYLQHASNIVNSCGAINYAHFMFFNPDAKWYFLRNGNSSPCCDDYKYIQVQCSLDLDNHIHELHAIIGNILHSPSLNLGEFVPPVGWYTAYLKSLGVTVN